MLLAVKISAQHLEYLKWLNDEFNAILFNYKVVRVEIPGSAWPPGLTTTLPERVEIPRMTDETEHAYESSAAISAPPFEDARATESDLERQTEPDVPQSESDGPTILEKCMHDARESLGITKLEDRVAFLEDFLSRSIGHDITKN